MKFFEIMPGLLVRGKLPRGGADNADILRAQGVTDVFCMIRPRDERIAQAYGVHYHHNVIPDGTFVDLEGAYRTACRVAAVVGTGGKAFVHCHAGRNRSGLVAALVVMILKGLSGADAVLLVQRQRPGSLVNEHMVATLCGLQAHGEVPARVTTHADLNRREVATAVQQQRKLGHML